MQLARKQTELDGSKHRHEQLQRKYDESTSEFEQRLDLARDKERQLITVCFTADFIANEYLRVV